MTYTVLAIDPGAELIGAATASYSLAVGNAVIAIAPDVGAVASQAYTNRGLRAQAITALRQGRTPADIIEHLPQWDDGYAWRQVAVIDLRGGTAAATGRECSAWTGEVSGSNVVMIGNLLAGPQVLTAMRDAFGPEAPDIGSGGGAGRAGGVGDAAGPGGAAGVGVAGPGGVGVAGASGTEGAGPHGRAGTVEGGAGTGGVEGAGGAPGAESMIGLDIATGPDDAVERFAHRLLRTLIAGEAAGGDARGRQSAAIQVVRMTDDAAWPPDSVVDLRADNSPNPLTDLAAALALQFPAA